MRNRTQNICNKFKEFHSFLNGHSHAIFVQFIEATIFGGLHKSGTSHHVLWHLQMS